MTTRKRIWFSLGPFQTKFAIATKTFVGWMILYRDKDRCRTRWVFDIENREKVGPRFFPAWKYRRKPKKGLTASSR